MKIKLIHILFPAKCIFCGKVVGIDEKQMICAGCAGRISFVQPPYCFKCGKELQDVEKEYCTDCMKRQHFYDRGLSLFRYGDEVRKSILGLKYSNQKINGKYFGKMMAERYGHMMREWKTDAIIPVPIHHKRLIKRGYNQAEVIAEALSEKTGIPVDYDLLERNKNTIPQKELDDSGRKKNVENAFNIKKNIVEYNSIVLVDDIYTTGSTIDECAKALKKAGIKKIYFITISIGYET